MSGVTIGVIASVAVAALVFVWLQKRGKRGD
jgi:hypothetical protein